MKTDGKKKKETPIGVLNCNPGNIRSSSELYQGEIDSRRGYKRFKSMPYGYRAMFRILRTYKRNHCLDTLEQMIYRWAPPSDNNKTEVYVNFVAKRSGIDRDCIVDTENRNVMCRIVEAMAEMECGGNTGWHPDMNEIVDGWKLL